VLWDGLTNDMNQGPVRDTLKSIHTWINDAESAALRR
jgi:hypothetical protein